MGMRGINGAPDLPLGGSSFHHPLAFSCRMVPTRSLAGTLGHTFWCNLLTWYSEQKSQPLSRHCFTRRHMAPDKPLFVGQQPTRYLPRRHALHHARAWPRSDPVTGAVRVEGHVFRREPASRVRGRPGDTVVPAALSVPFNLLPDGRNAEVAQLTADDSEQGTRRRL